jgi:hypothetical protein
LLTVMSVRSKVFPMVLSLVTGSLLCPTSKSEARVAVRCGDTDAIAKEVVEYSLLGSRLPFADHTCFKPKHYKYFHPEVDEAEGEITNWDRLIWFRTGKDKYKILSVKPDGSNYDIKVQFTLKGKPLETTYIYIPDPKYAKKYGICGFIKNPQHITRTDCADKKIVQPHIKEVL